jgi:hypothetical protein
LGQRSATTVAIHSAASALTSRTCWQRAWPRASKKRPSVVASWPGAAHTSRPASWSTTTVRHRWSFLYDTSSMPIRRSPAKRSRLASASATTRVTMRPTVAQATRSSSRTACLEVWTASQAAVSSNAGVAGAVACPGHGGHHHPMLGATDPGRLGLQVGADHAQVQRTPAPPALALVEAGAAPATPTAAAPGPLAGPHRHHQRLPILVEADPFDDRLLDTEQPGP